MWFKRGNFEYKIPEVSIVSINVYEGIKDVNEEGARAEPKGGGIKDSNGKITEAEPKGGGN